jgi:hypothetical protein
MQALCCPGSNMYAASRIAEEKKGKRGDEE